MTSSVNLLSALPVSPGDIALDALFEDQGVSRLPIDEMFTLEWATYPRCFPAQLLAEIQQAGNALTSYVTFPHRNACGASNSSSRKVLPKRSGPALLTWNPGPVTWELQRGAFLVRSGFVFNWQESA